MTKPFAALDFGDLPAEMINATLGTELEPGPVHMSGLAHRHAAEKHSDDYPVCRPHLEATILDPSFIGQAPRHGRNIELIRRIPGAGGSGVLVAVGLERDEAGRYRVRSFYVVTAAELDAKRRKGHVRPVVRRDPQT